MMNGWLIVLSRLCTLLLCLKTNHAGILDVSTWARSDTWLPNENETKCYGELGCLNITRSWYHLINRPFNVFPLPRTVINTKFKLYTRKNPTKGRTLKAYNEKSIEKSNFDPTIPTKFIIHGFIDTPLSNWVDDMRDALIKADDMNVIVVDWAGGSLPLYTQATANTRLVGLEIAYLINYLIDSKGLEAKKVHLIGHSLGAHTAGYAGSAVPGLGRITGLDPAEPYFQNMPSHVRLDPSDAELVDVIHTDGKSILLLGYGMSQPCGHLDFYPNNGKEQPGCDLIQMPLVPLTLIREGLEEASRVLVACNHVRAIKIFTESINSRCPSLAHQCSSYRNFLNGKCFGCKSNTGSCAYMGYHADQSPSLGLQNEVMSHGNPPDSTGLQYYTTTSGSSPFCMRQYRVSIQLADPPSAESWVQGFIRVTLHSDSGVIKDLSLNSKEDMRLEHGKSVSVVVSHFANLGGEIKKMELSWEYDMNVLEPRSLCLFWCNDNLYVQSVLAEEMIMPSRGKRNANLSNKLCSPGNKKYVEIPNKGKGVFSVACRSKS